MSIFISTLIVSFGFSPGYTKTVIEVTEDGTIYLITTEAGMDDVVEEVTAEELADIYYSQPVKLPQDDDSLNIIRNLIGVFEPAESNQVGGLE